MIKFGTGGWRSIIGEDFTKANIRILVQAMCNDMHDSGKDDKPVVIGYDRRFLSDIGAHWMCEVFAGNNIEVELIDKNSPTPLIMFEVKRTGAYFGAAVTASHNPALYNGVKIFTEGGRDASLETTDTIESYIDKVQEIASMDFDEAIEKKLVVITDPSNEYIDTILERVDKVAVRKRNLRVLLDPMYGVSKTSLQTILYTLRCDLDVINDRHDTLFGGRLPSPSAKTLTHLKQKVIEEGYDIGIGTDGDADRLGVIDDEGRFIHPNEILALLYYYLYKNKGWKGDVVRNLATTHLLDDMAEDFGAVCHEVPVGFKHISSAMERTDAVIGGESSGGLTIRGHIKGKDGIFAATLLIEMICVTDKKISEILNDIYDKYGYRCMVEKAYNFKAAKKKELMKLLYEDKALPVFPYELIKVSYMDGLKVYFKNKGWLIARFSGTEPVLRVFSEMPEKSDAENACNIMKNFLGV
ncbi:MAG: phosphoglucomutase/phosphomannomutase family protein [Clostridiales bacterium]|nr:phosphoglucomutase/phosphomannomutase family protein [Clostridiales bacterium]